MIHKENDPVEILNKIKIMMDYQLGKTLEEQSYAPASLNTINYNLKRANKNANDSVIKLAKILPFYNHNTNMFEIPDGYEDNDYEDYNGKTWRDVLTALVLPLDGSSSYNRAMNYLKVKSKQWQEDNIKRVLFNLYRYVAPNGLIKKVGSKFDGMSWNYFIKRYNPQYENKIDEIIKYVRDNPNPIPKPAGVSLFYPKIKEGINIVNKSLTSAPQPEKPQKSPKSVTGATPPKSVTGKTTPPKNKWSIKWRKNNTFPLYFGDIGSNVGELQGALGLTPDNKFGHKTLGAIRAKFKEIGQPYNDEAITQDLFDKIINSSSEKTNADSKTAMDYYYDQYGTPDLSTMKAEPISGDIENLKSPEIVGGKENLEKGLAKRTKELKTNLNNYPLLKQIRNGNPVK